MESLSWRWVARLCILCTFLFSGISSKCGYESCNKEVPGLINVHVVPHTHDDVGWLITVDQYYYQWVQFIIDTVIPELEADPVKRFIYVEIAFFSRWYDEQNDAMRHRVKKLVDEGRLEFILGGWSMNDEASTHYSAIIDNHKIGFEYLRKNFGDCGRPKIGWQIDPFGHSREQASIFSQFGFDGLFFGRLDYQDKGKRMVDKQMEMVWRGSPNNLGKSANLFTGVLPNMYQPPNGFCYDIYCQGKNNPEIRDNPKLRGYNKDDLVSLFLDRMYVQASWYKTKHLIVTMGTDFNYKDAHMWYKELDKLIKYVNDRQANGSNINLLYSTPSCYAKAINNDFRTWTTKDDDFFPYADRPHTFWTGYFTSRPAFKFYARYVNSFFQAVKQMDSLAALDNTHESRKHLHRLAEVLGVAQHHDGISGTAKQAVDYDYTERLTEGLNKAETVVGDVYNAILPKSSNVTLPHQSFCHYLNISVCNVTQTQNQIQVTLYNPLTWQVQQAVRIPVSGPKYAVLGPDGSTSLPHDVFPVSPVYTQDLGISKPATHQLVFNAVLPPLGLKTYFVSKTSAKLKQSQRFGSGGSSISGKLVQVDFTADGHLKSLTDRTYGKTFPLTQNFFYYMGHKGNCSQSQFQSSGAYIFRPINNTPEHIQLSTWSGVVKGNVVQEARQQFGDWISQVIRIYEDKPYVEVEWTVGPIPIGDNVGKEVVTRYNMDGIENKGVFYTDSNGREILERRLNYRPTWKLNQSEAVAGNYFPVNALIAIKDQSQGVQFTVLTDRSQGGTSLNNGDVELMVHRRLLVDDGKGVGEPLNETGVSGKGLITRGKHYLLLQPIQSAASVYRTVAKEVFMTPQPTFSPVQDPKTWISHFHTSWSGLKHALPPNVHLLSLEQFQHTGPVRSPNGSTPYLIRFEHFYEEGEDQILSKPVSFHIQALFQAFDIKDVHELSLGANIPIEEVERLHWRTLHNPSGDVNPTKHLSGTVVSLGPMEIVTLQANIRL